MRKLPPHLVISIRAISDALSPEDLGIVARYAAGELQREIGDDIGMPRTTVAFRIHRAAKRLLKMGHKLTLPGRGRRRERPKLVSVDPEAIEQLTHRKDASGRRSGTWNPQHKSRRRGSDHHDATGNE